LQKSRVKREYGVPEEDAADRWGLGHLFLDQDGIPTLVEVKRSSDTRARRRVAGQMLGYAANTVRYWPVEKMRARFEAACEARGEDPAAQVAALVEAAPDDENAPDAFWKSVEANLQRGRIRMLFVADRIPTELRRIVEFMNEQMKPAEVLAVEVKQYTSTDGDDLRTLVPTVIGQTAEAQQRKRTLPSGQNRWDEQTFFEALAQNENPEAVQVARSLQDWARRKGLRFWWGKGEQRGSFFPLLDHDGETHFTFSVHARFLEAGRAHARDTRRIATSLFGRARAGLRNLKLADLQTYRPADLIDLRPERANPITRNARTQCPIPASCATRCST
jgi:hypothetical protein